MKTKKIISRPRTYPCPSEAELDHAWGILHAQESAIYRTLLDARLAGLGKPYSVTRENTNTVLTIERQDHPEFTFVASSPDGLLEKIGLIEEAIKSGRQKDHHLDCCPLARNVFCVCSHSYDCPLHGRRCFGSHD